MRTGLFARPLSCQKKRIACKVAQTRYNVVKGVFCNVRCNGPAVFSESKTPMGTFPGNRRNFPRGEANDRFILDAQQRLPCGYDEASSGSDFIPS